MTPWEFKGRELANCTCEYGCPCQFNALPDKGHCFGLLGIIIDEGRYGDVRLDGLRIAMVFKWPGAIHLGNGEAIAFVDERADTRQREALLKIMNGQDTAPFATMFAIYASMLAKMHDPVFAPIEGDIDVDARTGRIFIHGYLDLSGRPIRNPVSGKPSRAQIVMPDGFEYELAEMGSASSRVHGPLQMEIDDKYGQFARLHLSNNGVVRGRPAP
jgi:hypothetical protein